MNNKLFYKIHNIIFIACIVFLSNCSTTKNIEEGQYLLKKNNILFSSKIDNLKFSEYTLKNLPKQKKNREILGFLPLYLWLYNIPNHEKVAKKIILKDKEWTIKNDLKKQKLGIKNKERVLSNKKPLIYKKKKKRKFLGQWLMDVAGEPPVILDSLKIHQSLNQFNIYMTKEGFFDVTTKYTVEYKNKNAFVNYTINPLPPYTSNKLTISSKDTNLIAVCKENFNPRLQSNEIISYTFLERKRTELTKLFQNKGYYTITKDHFKFKLDTNKTDLTTDIKLIILQNKYRSPDKQKEIITESHQIYKINKVSIYVNSFPIEQTISLLKQEKIDSNIFMYYNKHQKRIIKPQYIKKAITIAPDSLYSVNKSLKTYRNISNMGIFKSINIEYVKNKNNSLDCQIQLITSKKQLFRFETNGITRGQNLGIELETGYTHLNIFKGAEKLKINFITGIETQPVSSETTVENNSNSKYKLNTIEIGPEISLEVPRFIFFNYKNLNTPKTFLKFKYNYRLRPDYERTVNEGQYGYSFKLNKHQDFIFTPLVISQTKIDKSSEFSKKLAELNNPILSSSYEDHFILGTNLNYIYSNLNVKNKRFRWYYAGGLELAGNTLRILFNILEKPADTNGNYTISNTKFAQFVRTNHEIKLYHQTSDKNLVIYRLFGGIGIPLSNSERILPFSRSFFLGGSYSMRAWNLRELGPGDFTDVNSFYEQGVDKLGDIALEANIEYRFDLFGAVKGALFTDIGNVWFLNKIESQSSGVFSANFLNDLAISSGIGLRLDLNYFIIRTDFALKMKDPALPGSERWIFQPKNQINKMRYDKAIELGLTPTPYKNYYNFVIAIGYPF